MMLFLEITFKNFVYFLTNKFYRNFYLLCIAYGDAARYKQKSISIHNKKIKVADCLSFIYQYKEIYVDQSYSFSSERKNPTIIDCGSNIGLSVCYFREQYPEATILAIEADPAIADILKENSDRNNWNIQLIAKAAWIHDNGVSFSNEGSDSGSVNENSSTKIPSVRLKNVLAEHEQIDFLKIDIEGAESTVFPDCVEELHRVKNIFLEYHGTYKQTQDLDKMLSILTNAGFHYFIKTENKRKQPFINRHEHKMYDLQLNIYAYRKA